MDEKMIEAFEYALARELCDTRYELPQGAAARVLSAALSASPSPISADAVVEACAQVADDLAKEWNTDGDLWVKDGMPKTASIALLHSGGAEKVAAAIRALKGTFPAVDGWQPIDTAPKDGTRILIWFVHANARFSKDPVAEGWAAAHEAYWIDHNGGGWTWHGLCGAATLWQPLPTAPSTQEADHDNG